MISKISATYAFGITFRRQPAVVTFHRRLQNNSHASPWLLNKFPRTRYLHTMFVGSHPIDKRLERYTPYEFTADLSELKDGDRAAIKPLVQAAKIIDKIYIRQAWAGNEQLKKKLEELGDKKLLTLFNMYKGPWVSQTEREVNDTASVILTFSFY
jgi:hypothetical protein